MLRTRHALRLARELTGFAVANRVAWFLPVVFVLALAVALMVAGGAAAPYTIYTLF